MKNDNHNVWEKFKKIRKRSIILTKLHWSPPKNLSPPSFSSCALVKQTHLSPRLCRMLRRVVLISNGARKFSSYPSTHRSQYLYLLMCAKFSHFLSSRHKMRIAHTRSFQIGLSRSLTRWCSTSGERSRIRETRTNVIECYAHRISRAQFPISKMDISIGISMTYLINPITPLSNDNYIPSFTSENYEILAVFIRFKESEAS